MDTTQDDIKEKIREHIKIHESQWKNKPMREIMYDFVGDTFGYETPQIPLSELLYLGDECNDLISQWEQEVLFDSSIEVPVECHNILNNTRFLENTKLLHIHFEKWKSDAQFHENAVRIYGSNDDECSIQFSKKLEQFGYPADWHNIFADMTNVQEMKRLEPMMPKIVLQNLFEKSFRRRSIFDIQDYFHYVDELAERHQLTFSPLYLQEPQLKNAASGRGRLRLLFRRSDQYDHSSYDPIHGTLNPYQKQAYYTYKRNRRYTPIAVYQTALLHKAAYVWYDPESTDLEKCIAWTIDNTLITRRKNIIENDTEFVDTYKLDPRWNNVKNKLNEVHPYLLPLTLEQSWTDCVNFWLIQENGAKSLDDDRFIL